MANKPAISIIIPAYNAEDTVGACIESLLTQRTDSPFEILLVDDGSTDGTAETASRYPEVKVLRQSNAGAGVARNLGAREAQGWMLLFIDADCVATPGWLEALENALRSGADGAKGTLLTNQPELVARFTQLEYEDRYDRMRPQRQINFIDMGSAAYRRDVMLEVGQGGFDVSYPGASVEDQELSFRLAKLGCDLRFVPDATVYHQHPSTVKAYARRKFNIGRWKVLVHLRHPERIVSDSHTPPSLKAQLIMFYALVPALCAAPFSAAARRLSASLLTALAASGVPFIVKAARKDPLVAAVAPLMILLRAAGLGGGVVYGVVKLVSMRGRQYSPAKHL